MYEYTNDEFQFIYSNIVFNRITSCLSPVSNPTAYILGGQPGSGKSTLQRFILKNNVNVAIINADEFRVFHPYYKEIQLEHGENSADYTQPFINKITEKLIDDLSRKKYNLIIEGTLRSAKVPINTCKLLNQRDYHTELHIICVKPEISYQSTILRYENALSIGELPRATTKYNHDRVVNAICKNVDFIYKTNCFDKILLFNRDGKISYKGNPATKLKEILFGNFTKNELRELHTITNEIKKLMKKRNYSRILDYEKECTHMFCTLNCYIETVHHFKLITKDTFEKLKNNKDINLSHFSYINKGENVILKCEDIDIERIEKIIQSIEQQNNKNLLK